MTLETTPREVVETVRTRLAYCRLGPYGGTPLVRLQHFSGTMDACAPAVVNALAEERPVIVFDNTQVGKSSGTTPDNVAQLLAAEHPKLWRQALAAR